MGKFSRDKGVRNERKIVNLLKKEGVPARRVPLSGGTEYAKGDIEFIPFSVSDFYKDETFDDIVSDNFEVLVAEVKSGKTLPTKRIRDWLDGNDVLVLDEDHKPILVCMTLETMLELL